MLIALLAAAALMQNEEPQALMGWTIEPPATMPGQETELDRLSQSSSGRGFYGGLFSGDSDDERLPISVTLRALNKVTAQFEDVTVPIGESSNFGNLTLLPRTCSTRPPEEFPETTVFLEVYADENDVAGQRARLVEGPAPDDPVAALLAEDEREATVLVSQRMIEGLDDASFGEPIFKGWMFASSPSLNAMEHPTYDVWVIHCTMEDPEI